MATTGGTTATTTTTTTTNTTQLLVEALRSGKEELYREERDPTLRDSVHFKQVMKLLDEKLAATAKQRLQDSDETTRKPVISMFDCDCCFNLLTKPVTLLCGKDYPHLLLPLLLRF